MNCAIALILPGKEQQQLSERICYGLPGAIWTEPESLNLIIRNLGRLTHPQIDEIKECFERLYFNPFEAELEGISYLPQNRSQGQLLLHAKENSDIKFLKKEVDHHLAVLKIPADKQTPHILLGICQSKNIGEYLIHNGLFHASSGEMKACGLFSVHTSPKKIFFQELAHHDSQPFQSGDD